MAHMVDRMMYAGQVPWHGLGIQLPAECDGDTLRNLVFDWRAIERPVYLHSDDGLVRGYDSFDRYKALVRSDTGAPLAIVPSTYGVVQYSEALSLLDAAVGQGEARYLTAGTLDEGRRAWALATVPSCTYTVAGAELKPYLLLSTAHGLSRALRVLFTSVYVVCNNTDTAALRQAGVKAGESAKYLPNVLQIRHTSGARERVDQAAQLIRQARGFFGMFHEAALRLVNERMSTAEVRAMAETLLPLPDRKDRKRDVESSGAFKAQALIVDLFTGRQKAAAHAPGTKWAALNAVTELIDHHANRRTDESRFDAILFGQGAQLRQRAMDYLLAA